MSLYVEDGYVTEGYTLNDIYVSWSEKIIYIPRSYMTLMQEEPFEIRRLYLDDFRLALKSLEDDPNGMGNIDTHQHNTLVNVGGVVLARVIEIINGYTVTFENGLYAVTLYGANSNVGDVTNVNNVSIRSANSAGLIEVLKTNEDELAEAVWNGIIL